MRFAEPAPRPGGHRPSLRAAPRAHERADLTARLPPELAFLAAEGFSPEQLLNAIGAEPRAVRPLDKLLSEGHISEEAYYRALARHLGCQYYDGDPPLADAFDAIRGLDAASRRSICTARVRAQSSRPARNLCRGSSKRLNPAAIARGLLP